MTLTLTAAQPSSKRTVSFIHSVFPLYSKPNVFWPRTCCLLKERQTFILRFAPLPVGEHLHQEHQQPCCVSSEPQIWSLTPTLQLRGKFTPGNYLQFLFAFGGRWAGGSEVSFIPSDVRVKITLPPLWTWRATRPHQAAGGRFFAFLPQCRPIQYK